MAAVRVTVWSLVRWERRRVGALGVVMGRSAEETVPPTGIASLARALVVGGV